MSWPQKGFKAAIGLGRPAVTSAVNGGRIGRALPLTLQIGAKPLHNRPERRFRPCPFHFFNAPAARRGTISFSRPFERVRGLRKGRPRARGCANRRPGAVQLGAPSPGKNDVYAVLGGLLL